MNGRLLLRRPRLNRNPVANGGKVGRPRGAVPQPARHRGPQHTASRVNDIRLPVFPRHTRGHEALGLKLGKILVDLGYVSERDSLAVVSEHLGIAAISGSDYPAVPVLENALTFQFMKQCKFVPVALEENVVTLAMTDPLETATLESVRHATGHEVKALRRGSTA